MTKNSSQIDYGVRNIALQLQNTFRSYIEAQYHILDEDLIAERRLFLEEERILHQPPYLESTPAYQMGAGYQDLDIPSAVKALFQHLVGLNVGIYDQPYSHQARALEAFFRDKADLIIATGTGSGKTESFLMPILGALATEGEKRPNSAALPGCRALLLYPMNALVNDQVSRIRRMVGDENASKEISRGRGRPVRFGAYTGRTPYPGPRTAAADARHIAPLFEEHYLPLLDDPCTVESLKQIGQWPAKDLKAFFAESLSVTGPNGKARYNWRERLKTREADRELMTRHEMQVTCPDLLVTNYSMLEYMLMRPIERSLFQQTKDWLNSDLRNEFILVLDEAHMYRGAGGAEVALLLRRLFARLGIPRERVRCILTSASLGEGPAAKEAVLDFARDLTGLKADSAREMVVITGEREARETSVPATDQQVIALADFDLAAFQNYALSPERAIAAVKQLGTSLAWPTADLRTKEDIEDYLFSHLTGFGPLERLIETVSGKAVELGELENALFSSSHSARRATESLIALATFARRSSDKRTLLPMRLHMFFRGLPGLYACSDPQCSNRRTGGSNSGVLGRFFARSALTCGCQKQSRVYEFLTHRDCGSAFLRGYMSGETGDFLWHEPSGPIRDGGVDALLPVDVLVESTPHQDMQDQCREIWLDTVSGKVLWQRPSDTTGFRKAFVPYPEDAFEAQSLTFQECPVCTGRWRGERSKIMNHETKGEAPFATLVKTQLYTQPPVRKEDRQFPNGGRKVLLFSDGRQKAARLARDIPREVENDVFRQALVLAANRLRETLGESKPTRKLYKALLTVVRDFNLPLFDRNDAKLIEDDVGRLMKDYEGDPLREILDDFEEGQIASRYYHLLLQQLCGRYYSLGGSAVGFLRPCKKAELNISKAEEAFPSGTDDPTRIGAAIRWIGGLAEQFAFDKHINKAIRGNAFGYWKPRWGSNGRFPREIRMRLEYSLNWTKQNIERVESLFRSELCLEGEDGYYLSPDKLDLCINLNRVWYQCGECTSLLPSTIGGRCGVCGSEAVNALEPDTSEYIRARKGFWRDPIRDVLADKISLRNISVEEHTAQLSNRDTGKVYTTTEEHELRFRDLLISRQSRPIDVLSCTTTMEVGVDIGALVAVGLRNIPPQRENYQQRAGRAGRRGASVSTVVTFAQHGPHDSYYFHNPMDIVAGPPRTPDVKVDNPKIATRHVAAFLIQTFFHGYMDEHEILVGGRTSILSRALGETYAFFAGSGEQGPSYPQLEEWIRKQVIEKTGPLRQVILEWLPDLLGTNSVNNEDWIEKTASDFVNYLSKLGEDYVRAVTIDGVSASNEGADDVSTSGLDEQKDLLEFLFFHGLLPTYAFPTDLASFLIEKWSKKTGRSRVTVAERPQQSIQKALSEYAPGRLIVINKETYKSGGVTANVPATEWDRASPLFERAQTFIHCENCSYVQDLGVANIPEPACPVCGEPLRNEKMIIPQVFTPLGAAPVPEGEQEQEYTYATIAQFPVPVNGSDLPQLVQIGSELEFVVAADKKLVTVNKGHMTQGVYSGFSICKKCGLATTDDGPEGAHDRPYLVDPGPTKGRSNGRCDGVTERVFLGHTFSTDLLLLRIRMTQPMITDTGSRVTLRAVEDSLYSLAEALKMAASRHHQIDIDPSEFGAGFRIVPSKQKSERFLDVYIYDTLSGGAGYSELAGKYLAEILQDTYNILAHCPGNCDASCQDCLRHFHNQHISDRLDRHLGAALLKWAMESEAPTVIPFEEQVRLLTPLRRLLELDGFSCVFGFEDEGVRVPLIVRKDTEAAVVALRSGLIDSDEYDDPISRLDSKYYVHILNGYLLARNLPDMHQEIRALFS